MAEASEKTPVKSEEKAIERAPAEWSPLLHLRREFDRMIEDFPWSWRRPLTRSLFDVEPFWRGFAGLGAMPAVDIAEKDKEYEITAELPGLDESNIDVKFADGVLTIKGEKKDEKEERKKDYYLSERRYGSFQRSFPVPESVDANKIEAKFVNGVLTLKLPKSPEAQGTRRGSQSRKVRSAASSSPFSARAARSRSDLAAISATALCWCGRAEHA